MVGFSGTQCSIFHSCEKFCIFSLEFEKLKMTSCLSMISASAVVGAGIEAVADILDFVD
jgi:hypothetical protein